MIVSLSIKKRKILLSISLIFIILLFSANSIAFAQMPYYVVAYDNTTLGKNAYGTNGYNYVMSNPSIVHQHVSSLYVINTWPSYTQFAEVGWFANPWQSNSKPRFFAAWYNRGTYGERLLTYPTPGTNHYYTVRNVTGSDEWRWYIDGSLVHTRSSIGGFRKGYSIASSERGNLRDTNYSHFWNLRKRDYSGNWYYWANLSLLADTDSEYRLVKISNTECYIQR